MSKVMISISDEFLKQVDQLAKKEHRSRSELIRQALREYLLKKRITYPCPIDNPKVREALKSMEELRHSWKGKWDSTEVIRKMREDR
ncbi:MAG: CopG family ribbon-helix-helix protein [Candidatus Aminicenantia bacterium]